MATPNSRGTAPCTLYAGGHRPGDTVCAILFVWLLATTPEPPQGPLTEPLDLSLTVKADLCST
jgi:hypothetical protein